MVSEKVVDLVKAVHEKSAYDVEKCFHEAISEKILEKLDSMKVAQAKKMVEKDHDDEDDDDEDDDDEDEKKVTEAVVKGQKVKNWQAPPGRPGAVLPDKKLIVSYSSGKDASAKQEKHFANMEVFDKWLQKPKQRDVKIHDVFYTKEK